MTNKFDLSLVEGIALRCATVADASTITRHRRTMFRDMGHRDNAALDSMAEKFQPWVEQKIQSGKYMAWFAVAADDSVVAGTGLWLMDWPAHMVGSSSRRGNIVNVFTEPDFRRRGLARWLVEAAMDWCKVHSIDFVILHASPEGRSLYESLGFKASNEMQVTL